MIIANHKTPPAVHLRLFAFMPTWTDRGLVWLEWVDLTMDFPGSDAFAVFRRAEDNDNLRAIRFS